MKAQLFWRALHDLEVLRDRSEYALGKKKVTETTTVEEEREVWELRILPKDSSEVGPPVQNQLVWDPLTQDFTVEDRAPTHLLRWTRPDSEVFGDWALRQLLRGEIWKTLPLKEVQKTQFLPTLPRAKKVPQTFSRRGIPI